MSSSTSADPDPDLDDAVAAARKAMLAKLQGQKSSREALRDARKTATEAVKQAAGGAASTNVARSTDDFWQAFTPRARALREALAAAVSAGPGGCGGDAAFDSWAAEAAALQQQLNDCTLFLPAFDVRKAQKEVDALLEAAEEAKALLQPRKKFAFRRQLTAVQHSAPHAPAETLSSTVPALVPAPEAHATDPAKIEAARHAAALAEDEHTIEQLSCQTVFVPAGHFTVPAAADVAALDAKIAAAAAAAAATGGPARAPPELAAARRRAAANAQGRDIRLLNLSDCVVVILDPLRALRVDGLTRCHVYCGPIAGSVLLHNCSGCVFMLAARQLRIHTSRRCDYYLRCMSRPIIEHCAELRFAPYGLRYGGFESQLVAAALDRPARADMWRCVDDFGWHRVQRSPNWDVLPRVARIGHCGSCCAEEAAAALADAEAGGSGVRALAPAAVEFGLSVAYDVDTGEDNACNENATATAAAKAVAPPSAAAGEDEL